ncbi:MAG: hypothetical protein ACLT2T_12155 [Bilophila wadsworthia]
MSLPSRAYLHRRRHHAPSGGIRRTGATLAPEAGSQRLRDIINKGVTEEGLMLHVRKLLSTAGSR